MSNGDRPIIKKITMEMEYPPGSGKTIKRTYPEKDGDELPTALFWGDLGAEILGAYYKHVKKNHKMSFDKLKANFKEERAKKLCNPGEEIIIDDTAITTLWNTEDTTVAPDEPKLLAAIAKDPGCDSSG